MNLGIKQRPWANNVDLMQGPLNPKYLSMKFKNNNDLLIRNGEV